MRDPHEYPLFPLERREPHGNGTHVFQAHPCALHGNADEVCEGKLVPRLIREDDPFTLSILSHLKSMVVKSAVNRGQFAVDRNETV